MKKINLYILQFPLIMLFLLVTDASVNAEDQKDEKQNYLTVGSGFEYLYYTEYEPDTDIYTDTSLLNAVSKFEGGLSLNKIFMSIKGVLPVSLRAERETWERSGRVYQTNDLEYTWLRIDGNVGYMFYDWLNPYLGLRWSKSRQERSRFFPVEPSEPFNGKAIETNRAVLAAAGLQGILKSPTQWELKYGIEYFLPLSSRTKNSSLPGWRVSGIDGYSIGARAVFRYNYSPSLFIYFELSGEKAYWDGSCWADYPGGSAKWPDNKTLSLNCIMGSSWYF